MPSFNTCPDKSISPFLEFHLGFWHVAILGGGELPQYAVPVQQGVDLRSFLAFQVHEEQGNNDKGASCSQDNVVAQLFSPFACQSNGLCFIRGDLGPKSLTGTFLVSRLVVQDGIWRRTGATVKRQSENHCQVKRLFHSFPFMVNMNRLARQTQDRLFAANSMIVGGERLYLSTE